MRNIVKHKYGSKPYNFPWFVLFISLAVLIQFLMINYKNHFEIIHSKTFTLFTAPDTIEIYKGKYWGVFTNNFTHIYWGQLVVNLFGIWLFGAYIERRIGFRKTVWLIILFSIIPSLWQLTLTTQPGIGLSGVNYALFGYILSKSHFNSDFKLRGRYILLLLMLAIIGYCYYINYTIENVFRTEAMFLGLLLGLLLGRLSELKDVSFKVIILGLVVLVSLPTLFYSPWSSEWQLYKGIVFHEKGNYRLAKKFYRTALKIDKTNLRAKNNLDLLDIDKLKVKAYKSHVAGNYDIAKKYYEKILKIDPKDIWAIENIKELP